MLDKTLKERKEEIQLLLDYAAPPEHLDRARALLDQYEADTVALHLLYAFYSHLPEGCDDAVGAIRLLARCQGTVLLGVSTLITDYLYVATPDGAALLGTLAEGIQDEEVRAFFGFDDEAAFAELQAGLEQCAVYESVAKDQEVCPVCFVASGEYHTLGCPVEICPWCKGQLTNCNCRFSQLGLDALEQESDLEELREKLDDSGRIPFVSDHRPAYLADEDEDSGRQSGT